MIVAQRKPLEEILAAVEAARRVAIVGCGECVTVCMAGGEKEVGVLTELITIARRKDGLPIEIEETTVKRQCDAELLEPISKVIARADIVVSMACGCGVQMMAEVFPSARIIPALNTTFMGVTLEEGEWAERCQACGDCKLGDFAGVCPITRCAKGILNGPCGGSEDGNCEINRDLPCAWQLIIDRLEVKGELDRLAETYEPKDWSSSRDGGPRHVSRPDVKR